MIVFCSFMLHRLLDTDVKRDALELAKAGLWDDAGPEQAIAQGGAGGGTLANSQVSKILTGLEIIIQFVYKHPSKEYFLQFAIAG